MARPSRGSGHTLTILQLLSMAALCEAHHFNKQIEVLRGRPTQPIMASIKFSRSLLLLVALIKCSMTSEINRKITKYSNTHIISKYYFLIPFIDIFINISSISHLISLPFMCYIHTHISYTIIILLS